MNLGDMCIRINATGRAITESMMLNSLVTSSTAANYANTLAKRRNIAPAQWWSFLLFWYLSAATQLLLGLTHAASFEGFKDASITALLWLIPVLLWPKHIKSVTGVLAVLIWLLALPGFGYFLIYRQELTQSLLFIVFESNQSESREYVQNYLSLTVVGGFVLFSLIPLVLWSKIKPYSDDKPRAYLAAALIALLVLAYPISRAVKGRDMQLAYRNIDRHLGVAPPWQLLFGYLHYKKELNDIENNLLNFNKIPPLQGLTEQAKPLPTTIVLVIGESTTRLHMGLYGYARDTNPKLNRIKNELQVFSNVFASRPNTIESLEQVLTFADQQHPDWYKTKPSLIAMMKQAGYRTYWVTNQQTLTARNTMLTTFAKQTDTQVFLNTSRQQNAYSFDEKVLAPYANMLNEQYDKKLIVVHLLGTHMKYSYRYPASFDVFKDNRGLSPELKRGLSDAKLATINAYDNAIRYNDSVVYALISQLKQQQQHSLLVYFSDHGDDVYDSANHDFQGRNEGSPTYPMYAIPFVIWHSPDWFNADKLAQPAILQRQYDNADFIYTFSDLIGLNYRDYLAHESIVNAAFADDAIMVGNPHQKSLKMLAGTKPVTGHH